MPDYFKGLVDQWGRPIGKATLTQEVAAPTLTGVRSPIAGYPGDGLTPVRLASILREADQGDPVRYMELAQTVEERDLHYVGVLGTRRRSVSQLEITVEAAGESTDARAQADRVSAWLKRDELADELFDLLDAVGRGYAFSEIIWDSSTGQWEPARLEWRDQRWFRFERANLTVPLMLDENGQEVPLPGFKFISPVIKAKSGLPLRSGLSRIVAWAWMFKAFTSRDWAIFTQTYGQPVRIGKYGPGATDKDKETLYRAVAGIAGDCAAIIPDSMVIDFVEASSIASSGDLYKDRSDWLDQQVSKAVLGQTATTDSVTGGLGSGREHRQVQEDIERADAKALAATINRDLIRPWIQLEWGPQKEYPRLRIGRAEETDVKMTVDAVSTLVPLGLKIGQRQMRDVIGLGAPAEDDELLTAPAPPEPDTKGLDEPPLNDRGRRALQLQTPDAQRRDRDAVDDAVAEIVGDWEPLVAPIVAGLAERIGSATSIEEVKAILEHRFAGLDAAALTEQLARAAFAARIAGEADELLA